MLAGSSGYARSTLVQNSSMSSDSAPQVSMLGLFPTPLLSLDLPDPGDLNAALKTSITQRRANHPGIARSNLLGWHSDANMVDWAGQAGTYLIRAAIQMCSGATTYVGEGAAPPDLDWGAQMWANVSPPGAGNEMHAHPGAIWSIVYYVDDGYGKKSDRAEGGELILADPRYPSNRMYMPEVGIRGPDGEPQSPQHVVTPRTGRMVAFPSWVLHSVRPYSGNGERISIAINLMIKETPL